MPVVGTVTRLAGRDAWVLFRQWRWLRTRTLTTHANQ
jgi:hypothetical protein